MASDAFVQTCGAMVQTGWWHFQKLLTVSNVLKALDKVERWASELNRRILEHDGTWWDVMGRNGTWWNMTGCGEIWWDNGAVWGDSLWTSLPTPSIVPSYPIMSHYIPSCLTMSHHVPSYPIMFQCVPLYPIMSHHIPLYPIASHYISPCAIMFHNSFIMPQNIHHYK